MILGEVAPWRHHRQAWNQAHTIDQIISTLEMRSHSADKMQPGAEGALALEETATSTINEASL